MNTNSLKSNKMFSTLKNNVSNAYPSFLSKQKTPNSKLLTVPVNANNSIYNNSFDTYENENSSFIPSSLTTNILTTSTNQPSIYSSVIRYLFIIIIIVFLMLNIVLYLIKPINVSITEIYNPLLGFFGFEKVNTSKNIIKNENENENEDETEDENEDEIDNKNTAINNLKHTINNKNNKNKDRNISNKQGGNNSLDNNTSNDLGDVQQINNPLSGSGYCYIGEDKGFRSCIEVGKGDICMSGDIFPTKDICINPNLRE